MAAVAVVSVAYAGPLLKVSGLNPFKKDWLGLALRIRWKTARALAPRRRVDSRGLRFTLQCDNWVTYYRWRSYNSKEPETLDWIDAWMKEGDIFFDVGANVGLYTLYAALRHPTCRVVAFEPEYSNLHYLRDNILENRLQGRVTAYSLALSRLSGVSCLHLQDTTPGSALHTESRALLTETQAHRPVVLEEGIGTITLDEFCRQSGLIPNVLKVDVDGAEPAVLEGGVETLKAPEFRSLIIELPDPEIQRTCSRLLQGAGLRLHWRDPQGRSPNEVWVRGG